ncbi:hypothetical protein HPT29_001925 [Microvirga terrae]|uniref:Uncharacterized protein n=1 Tax=Microvirga terrae TaxID=2740529 RepID=A0ABY5RRQ6_9HYPH|nr:MULTISPECIES: hypothetical protein [Microvirga]MBQ0821569.1 hypothetical protein [Microvirga sp. HBU67558]UVF19936.1 hypothetical protein HPT29_001925 [Microvirga terrae]
MRAFPFDQAADYRRRAHDAREMAAWISLNDARRQLLEYAQHMDALATAEEQKALQIAPIQVSGAET